MKQRVTYLHRHVNGEPPSLANTEPVLRHVIEHEWEIDEVIRELRDTVVGYHGMASYARTQWQNALLAHPGRRVIVNPVGGWCLECDTIVVSEKYFRNMEASKTIGI